MKLVRYAVRYLSPKGQWLYRSARFKRAFGPWAEAQLWENPKTAATEAKAHREPPEYRLRFQTPLPSCVVEQVLVEEPE